eukprot:scaffold2499_cov125-Cylindrotheca_fusiformis.AAC.34
MKLILEGFLVVFSCLVDQVVAVVEEHGGETNAVYRSYDLMSSMMARTDIYSRRLQQVQINKCIDATEWFPWDEENNGENYLRLYHECGCSGDFRSSFNLLCVINNFCFVADDNDTEQCMTRTESFDFSVDPDSGYITTMNRHERVDSFLTNFPVTGNFTIVHPGPCANALSNYSLPDAVATCTNATACPLALATEDYTAEEIEYLCPFVSFNGMKCQAFNQYDCQNATNETIYSLMPDCSNVNPCLTPSCQAYPVIEQNPSQRLYRYPQCSDDGGADDPTSSPSVSSYPSASSAPSSITDIMPLLPTTSSMPSSHELCSKTSELLRTNEMLENYYTCGCSGDHVTEISLDCYVYNYCLGEDSITATTRNGGPGATCVNQHVNVLFSLDEATHEVSGILDASECTEYLTNGPQTGPLCRKDTAACLFLFLENNFTVTEAGTICREVGECRSYLQNSLNYTAAEAQESCPTVTLGGSECNTYGYDNCAERDGEILYRTQPDCSNVEPCATSSCRSFLLDDQRPERFVFTYPQCTSSSASSGAPTSEDGEAPALSPSMDPVTSPPLSSSSPSAGDAPHREPSSARSISPRLCLTLLVVHLFPFVLP